MHQNQSAKTNTSDAKNKQTQWTKQNWLKLKGVTIQSNKKRHVQYERKELNVVCYMHF